MSSTPAVTRVLGTMRALPDGTGAVRVEDTYATDVDDLWSALTEPTRLARWIADVEGDLRVGGQFRARFTSSWAGTGEVEVCDPPHRLVVRTWEEGETPTVMEATLTADGDVTRLVVEERGLPLGSISAYGAGWQAHLEDLAGYLAGRDDTRWQSRWSELRATYDDLTADLG
jgi:uncharacterized protein YndB with AHSA1/START domain